MIVQAAHGDNCGCSSRGHLASARAVIPFSVQRLLSLAFVNLSHYLRVRYTGTGLLINVQMLGWIWSSKSAYLRRVARIWLGAQYHTQTVIVIDTYHGACILSIAYC
jgi:hypothetical protein